MHHHNNFIVGHLSFAFITTGKRKRGMTAPVAGNKAAGGRRGETLKEASKEKDVRISNIVAAKG